MLVEGSQLPPGVEGPILHRHAAVAADFFHLRRPVHLRLREADRPLQLDVHFRRVQRKLHRFGLRLKPRAAATTAPSKVALLPSKSIECCQSTVNTPGAANGWPWRSAESGRSICPGPSIHRRFLPRSRLMFEPVSPRPRPSKRAGRPTIVTVALGADTSAASSRSPRISSGRSPGREVCVSRNWTPSSIVRSVSAACCGRASTQQRPATSNCRRPATVDGANSRPACRRTPATAVAGRSAADRP